MFEASFRLWLQKCQALRIAPSPALQSPAITIVSGRRGVEGWLHGRRKAQKPNRPRGASQLLVVPQFTACKTRMGRLMGRRHVPASCFTEHSWECVC